MIPREIFHVVTKTGKVVGPVEHTLGDAEHAVHAANRLPEAALYGPYGYARFTLSVADAAAATQRAAAAHCPRHDYQHHVNSEVMLCTNCGGTLPVEASS